MRNLLLLTAFISAYAAAATAPADSIVADSESQSVGLVLSGGGAKGIAHIGFIQALEENDIPIDCVTGTSMGAIVGSLYAIGMSPDQMMDLIRSDSFKMWSSGEMPPSLVYQYAQPGNSPGMLSFNFSPKSSSSMTNILPTRLINPLPMSFAFMNLYAASTGECDSDFNRLMVPLRTVASDIYTHKSVVFSHGELADAVRASMSFPLVFQPIKVNGVLLYDGGLYDVYPVNVMEKDFNPSRIIGVDVSTPNTHPSVNNLVSQLENMIMTGDGTKFPTERGVNVKFDLSRFGLLDWNDADTIFAIGYRRGISMMDSIKAKISARRPLADVTKSRERWHKGLKDVVFTSLDISGTSPQKSEYLRYLFTGNRQESNSMHLTIDNARKGFYRAASTGRLRNLVPHAEYCDSTSYYNLLLDADVDEDFKVGVGGFITSSAGSMIYGSLRYDPFCFNRLGWSVEGWAGANYLAAVASTSLNLPTRTPSRISALVKVMRKRQYDTEKMIYRFNDPTFLQQSESGARLRYELAVGQHGILTLHAAYKHLTTRYRSVDIDNPNYNGTNRLIQDVADLSARYVMSNLDDCFLPTSGSRVLARASLTAGDRKLSQWDSPVTWHNGAWGDFEVEASHWFDMSRRISLGLSGSAYYSTRKLIGTYETSLVNARPFEPDPASLFLFDPDFRANSYLTAGLHPVLKISKMFELRLDGWCFAPMRKIKRADDGSAYYGKWFDAAEFLGEFSAVIKLPAGALRGYVNYRTSPTQHWSGGVSFGIPVYAPE